LTPTLKQILNTKLQITNKSKIQIFNDQNLATHLHPIGERVKFIHPLPTGERVRVRGNILTPRISLLIGQRINRLNKTIFQERSLHIITSLFY
jgi:acyl dehydratase